jgi:hypothetical protein
MSIEKLRDKYPNIVRCCNEDLKGCFRTNEVNKEIEYFEILTNKNGITFFRFFKEYLGERIYSEPEQFLMGNFDKSGTFLLAPTWKNILRQFDIPEKIISVIFDKFAVNMNAPVNYSIDDIENVFKEGGIKYKKIRKKYE